MFSLTLANQGELVKTVSSEGDADANRIFPILNLGVPPAPMDDCPVFRQIVEFRFLEIWALGLELDFSQLFNWF